jgi:hypothetical protein
MAGSVSFRFYAPDTVCSTARGKMYLKFILLGVLGVAFPLVFTLPLLENEAITLDTYRVIMSKLREKDPYFRMDSRGPRNLHLAFLGDSIGRHMHASLVYYLHTGEYLTNTPQPNLLEGGLPTREEFRAFAEATMNHTEVCDCLRPEGPFIPWGRMHRIWENAYYLQEERNNYVTQITKAGYFESHGHWDPSQIYSNDTYRNEVRGMEYPPSHFLWQGDWEQTIRDHISRLVLKPRYVVVNAGLWPNDLLKNGTLPAIRRALDDHDMVGIYRTTTKQIQDVTTTLVPHDVEGCRHLHYCMDLSWTGTITDPAEYSDLAHFRANTTRRFNKQLLGMLQEIVSMEQNKAH